METRELTEKIEILNLINEIEEAINIINEQNKGHTKISWTCNPIIHYLQITGEKKDWNSNS